MKVIPDTTCKLISEPSQTSPCMLPFVDDYKIGTIIECECGQRYRLEPPDMCSRNRYWYRMPS